MVEIQEDSLLFLMRDASEVTLKKLMAAPQYEDSLERIGIASSPEAVKKLPMEMLVKLRHTKNYHVRVKLIENDEAMRRLPLAEIVTFAKDEYINVQDAFASSKVAMSRVPVSLILKMQRENGNISTKLAANPEVAKKLTWKQLEYFLKREMAHNDNCSCAKFALASNLEAIKKMPKEVVIEFFNDKEVGIRDRMMKSSTARVILEAHLHSTRQKVKN